MNTMLPFASFADDCLRHLLADPAYPPRRKQPHPCVEMWRGMPTILATYRNTFLNEWVARNLHPMGTGMMKASGLIEGKDFLPAGVGDDLHATYREHMLAKYGATGDQPDAHFIAASADWTESPKLHKPFPFPTPPEVPA